MTEILPQNHEIEKKPDELTISQLAMAVRAIGESSPKHLELADEAANRLDKLQNLNKLLGLLAPKGTAPSTALEQIWDQSDSSSEESPVLLELRSMLESHWGERTPAIRKAEGLPPVE